MDDKDRKFHNVDPGPINKQHAARVKSILLGSYDLHCMSECDLLHLPCPTSPNTRSDVTAISTNRNLTLHIYISYIIIPPPKKIIINAFGAGVGNQVMIHVHVTSRDNSNLCIHRYVLSTWVFHTSHIDQYQETATKDHSNRAVWMS